MGSRWPYLRDIFYEDWIYLNLQFIIIIDEKRPRGTHKITNCKLLCIIKDDLRAMFHKELNSENEYYQKCLQKLRTPTRLLFILLHSKLFTIQHCSYQCSNKSSSFLILLLRILCLISLYKDMNQQLIDSIDFIVLFKGK